MSTEPPSESEAVRGEIREPEGYRKRAQSAAASATAVAAAVAVAVYFTRGERIHAEIVPLASSAIVLLVFGSVVFMVASLYSKSADENGSGGHRGALGSTIKGIRAFSILGAALVFSALLVLGATAVVVANTPDTVFVHLRLSEKGEDVLFPVCGEPEGVYSAHVSESAIGGSSDHVKIEVVREDCELVDKDQEVYLAKKHILAMRVGEEPR